MCYSFPSLFLIFKNEFPPSVSLVVFLSSLLSFLPLEPGLRSQLLSPSQSRKTPATVHELGSFQLSGLMEILMTADTFDSLFYAEKLQTLLHMLWSFLDLLQAEPIKSLLRQVLSLGKQSRNHPFLSCCA